jgi:hypothetical protein
LSKQALVDAKVQVDLSLLDRVDRERDLLGLQTEHSGDGDFELRGAQRRSSDIVVPTKMSYALSGSR